MYLLLVRVNRELVKDVLTCRPLENSVFKSHHPDDTDDLDAVGVSSEDEAEGMEVQTAFLLVSAVSGPFTSRLAVCICFSWFSRSEVCAFVWGIFVRGLHVETFVRVLRSSRCRL